MNLKITYFIIVIFIALICTNKIVAETSKNKKLNITGTIIGIELNYGHGYNIYKNEEPQKSYLIVRIDSLIKGVENSKFILINYKWGKVGVTFNDDNLHWNFSLSKKQSCSTTLRDLQFIFLGGKKISGIQPRFKHTSGYKNEVLPFNVNLPCYETSLKKMQKIDSQADSQEEPENKQSTYVLEEELWLNPSQSPLRVFFGGSDEFTNISDKIISEFTLGCVSTQTNKHQIVKEFAVENKMIKLNNTIFTINNANLAPSMDKLYTCYQMKAKLTAIMVKFEDGATWKFQ